jgi:hypothetical protein
MYRAPGALVVAFYIQCLLNLINPLKWLYAKSVFLEMTAIKHFINTGDLNLLLEGLLDQDIHFFRPIGLASSSVGGCITAEDDLYHYCYILGFSIDRLLPYDPPSNRLLTTRITCAAIRNAFGPGSVISDENAIASHNGLYGKE